MARHSSRVLPLALLLLGGATQVGSAPYYLDFAFNGPCNSTLTGDVRQLVHQRRFDVVIKFLYISFYADSLRNPYLRVPRVALQAYQQHELHWNGCREERKASCQDFLKAFRTLYRNIARDGFDPQYALPVCPLNRLPLGSYICDGAHRTTIALLLDRPTPIQCSCNATCQYKLGGVGHNWDFHFFLRRGLPVKFVETAVYHFIRRSRDMYVLHVWPSATVLLQEHASQDGNPLAWVQSAINLLNGHIMYFKRVYLNFDAHVMYTNLAYGDAVWISRKAESTFREGAPMWVFFVRFPSADAAKEARDIVRGRLVTYTGQGNVKHTLHVTDGVRDELLLARHLLFRHSLHYLNASSPGGKAACHAASQRLSRDVPPLLRDVNKGIDLHEDFFALDSGSVLSFYGIRNSSDLDVVFNSRTHADLFRKFDGHHDHHEAIEDLLYDPNLHGFCYGVKFLALPEVQRYKHKRHGAKDPKDLQLMGDFLLRWP
eukprot:EG_transcript_5761